MSIGFVGFIFLQPAVAQETGVATTVEELKNEYINLWLSSKQDDISKRENLHKAIKLLPEVERHLRIIVEKGIITKAQLGRLHKVV